MVTVGFFQLGAACCLSVSRESTHVSFQSQQSQVNCCTPTGWLKSVLLAGCLQRRLLHSSFQNALSLQSLTASSARVPYNSLSLSLERTKLTSRLSLFVKIESTRGRQVCQRVQRVSFRKTTTFGLKVRVIANSAVGYWVLGINNPEKSPLNPGPFTYRHPVQKSVKVSVPEQSQRVCTCT